MNTPVTPAPTTTPALADKGDFTFRSWLWLFMGMIAAELGVLLQALAPGHALNLTHLGVVSLYAQWINILALATLMLLEPWLKRLPRLMTWLCSWLLVIVVAAGVAALVGWVDQALLWGLTDHRWPPGHLVLRTALLTALLAGLVLRYQILHWRWQNGLRAQEQARFQALQARIHPHFLFNSLNTIAALTMEDPAQAEHAIENLSDLLRGTLRDPDRNITLQEELALCRSYLEIEALRLGTRLRVAWQLTDLPQTLPVPPLLLQPLVENAIIHGIQRCPEGGTVTIRGWCQDERLWLEISNPMPVAPMSVSDSAAAVPASVAAVTHSRQSGIALDNLRGRLDLRYAGAARLHTRIETVAEPAHPGDASGGGKARFIARLQLPLPAATGAMPAALG